MAKKLAMVGGFRGLAIVLAMVCMVFALVFPLHHTITRTSDGIEKMDARALDVLVETYSDSGTLLTSTPTLYSALAMPSGFTNSLLASLNIIWILLIGLAFLMLLLEFFKAEDMGRENQFVLLGGFFSMIAVLAFYYTWSAYIFALNGYQFIQANGVYATGLGIGFYGAIVGTVLSLFVALVGYASKRR